MKKRLPIVFSNLAGGSTERTQLFFLFTISISGITGSTI